MQVWRGRNSEVWLSQTLSVYFFYLFCFCRLLQHLLAYHWKTVLIYLRVVHLTLRYPIMPSHLRHLWPLWPCLCSPINPPPRPTTAHAHLAGPVGRAAGPGLPGLPSIQSSWKSHLPVLFLSKTIKTQNIYNKSVSGSIWEKKKRGLSQGNCCLKTENNEFSLVWRKRVRQMALRL